MTDTDPLITIGAVARASGLTASALRFYDDGGLLIPARVDPVTGYRYYDPAQCERAVLIRRLREIGLPLDAVAEILAGDPHAAAAILDDHVRTLNRRAEQAASVAAAVKQVLGAGGVTVPGAVLAEAIGQVVGAASRDPTIPVLTGVLLEVAAGTLTLTATDRYRLSTRSISGPPTEHGWQAVVRADDLAGLRERLRRRETVTLIPAEHAVTVRGGDLTADCARVDGEFPDYRGMLAVLAPVRTRVVIDRAALLDALEGADDPAPCAVGADAVVFGDVRIPVSGSGPLLEVAFSPSSLAAAVAGALGPDVMLDLAAADQPVVVRSATDGDLTTLVMPRRR
ncbi:DNA polymerase III subunit beta family protein [Nocardia takedensis]